MSARPLVACYRRDARMRNEKCEMSLRPPSFLTTKKEIQPSANGKKSFAIKLTAAVISEETSLNFSEDSNGAYDS